MRTYLWCQSMNAYFRLQAPDDAPPEVLKYNGQLMQRFPFIDTDNLIGLAPLTGAHDEGAGIRIPEEWALAVSTPQEEAHGEWLSRTFFQRRRYVSEEELAKLLCPSCQGSGCKECGTTGISGQEASEILL